MSERVRPEHIDRAIADMSARRPAPEAPRREPRRGAFPSLRGYQRSFLGPDLLAGLALLAIAVPEQLATSRLAGMPPVTGYYAFVAGTALFCLLGSNPRLSVGADSTLAPLFAVGVAHLAPTGSRSYEELVALLAVMVGGIVVIVGLLHLGWIAELLSAPIITGFMAGVALIIIVHQLPDLLGLASVGGSTLHRLDEMANHLRFVNGWTMGVGVTALAFIAVLQHTNRRLPAGLLALVGSGAVVAALDLVRRHGVAVLGTVTHGVPRTGLPGVSFSDASRLVPLAAVVALVVISQTAAVTRGVPQEGADERAVGRDFLGVGAGNIFAGLVGAFPVNASPPRSAAVASAGGRTQLAGLSAAAVIVVLIPLSGLLKDVPLTVLAAYLIFVALRIIDVADLRSIWRFDLFEFGLAVVTLLAVALIGVEQGIAVAVGLAILDRTRLTARPQLHQLGRIPHTTSWVPIEAEADLEQVPGVQAVLFAAPLWYANATRFEHEVASSMRTGTRLLVLDAEGMSDLDFTGSRALGRVLDELDRHHVAFAMARVGSHARRSLERSGLLSRIGDERLFPSADAAVSAFTTPPASAGTPDGGTPSPGDRR